MTLIRQTLAAWLLSAALIALNSCSDSEAGHDTPQLPVGEISVVLVSAPAGSQAESRSVVYDGDRTLWSSEAASSVDQIHIALYEQSGGNWVKADGVAIMMPGLTAVTEGIYSWNRNVSNTSLTDYSNAETLRLEYLKPLTAYKLVAWAVPATANLSASPLYPQGTDMVSNITLTHYPTALNASATEDICRVDETFGGYIEFSTDAEGRIAKGQRLVMYRQVAGVLGYFVNIPASIDGETVKYIRIHASAYADSYIIPSYGKQNQTSTIAVSAQSIAAAGGDYTGLTAVEIEIPETATVGPDNLYKIPASTGSPATVENSLISGRFLVPFARQVGQHTFTVHLCDENRRTLHVWNGVIKDPAEGETKYVYNVNRNQFYSFGFKPHTNSVEGDVPIDLSASKGIEIYVEVEPAYEEEHEIPIH